MYESASDFSLSLEDLSSRSVFSEDLSLCVSFEVTAVSLCFTELSVELGDVHAVQDIATIKAVAMSHFGFFILITFSFHCKKRFLIFLCKFYRV